MFGDSLEHFNLQSWFYIDWVTFRSSKWFYGKTWMLVMLLSTKCVLSYWQFLKITLIKKIFFLTAALSSLEICEHSPIHLELWKKKKNCIYVSLNEYSNWNWLMSVIYNGRILWRWGPVSQFRKGSNTSPKNISFSISMKASFHFFCT